MALGQRQAVIKMMRMVTHLLGPRYTAPQRSILAIRKGRDRTGAEQLCPGGARDWRVGGRGLGGLMWGLQHLHEEGVNGRVPDELEEEQVLQALEPDGTQCR